MNVTVMDQDPTTDDTVGSTTVDLDKYTQTSS